MSIKLYNNSGGYIDINSGGNGSTANTLTIPASAGTVMTSGNMPAFSAYKTSTQAISHDTRTKVTFDTEDFDTNSNFASNRFTPTVDGYYLLTTNINFDLTVSRNYALSIFFYKNGAEYSPMSNPYFFNSQTNNAMFSHSVIVYANGTTDYFEVYAWEYDYTSGGSGSLRADSGKRNCMFTGCLIRGA